MASPISIQANIKAGMCPHGVPQYSCPICNKQAGAMGHSGFSRNFKKSNEWSYQKCYVVGMEIKATIQRKENAKNFYEKQFQNSLSLNKNIYNISEKLNQIIQNINSQNIKTSIQFLMNTVISPLLNVSAKFIDNIVNFQQKAFNMIYQVGEKIVSIVGEIKNFVERKIIDNIKQKAKKIMLFCLSVIEDENYQNDETLTVFKSRELRKYIVKILKKRENNEYNSDKDK